MAMEERKCQMSWSSKKSSRMQSRLCSRDSAGVFYAGRGELSPCPPRRHPLPPSPPATYLPGAEPLEEEEEGEAPDHGGADNAEQGDELDALAAAELEERPGSPRRGHPAARAGSLWPSTPKTPAPAALPARAPLAPS